MPIVGGIIGGVGSIVGGLIGSSGAKAAGKTISHWGQSVGNQLEQTTTQGQTGINTASTNAVQQAGNAQQGMQNAVGTANTTLGNVFQGQTANLNPYLQTGSTAATNLGAALSPGGALTTTFTAPTAQQVQNTPGYQFQLAQGNQAVQRLAAASGGLQSGGTLKSLDQYSQGLASTYYQNAFNNALQGYQTNYQNTLGSLMAGTNVGLQGTNMYNQAAMNYGNLSGANLMSGAQYEGNVGMQGAGMNLQGQEASGQLGVQGMTSAGNFYMGGAQGYAAGQAGSAQAWQGALNGFAGAMGGMATGLKAPASSGFTSYGSASPFDYNAPYAYNGTFAGAPTIGGPMSGVSTDPFAGIGGVPGVQAPNPYVGG